MIRTEDLVGFFDNIIYHPEQTDYTPNEIEEYTHEIVARLRAYDKLKESIEKLCRDLSSGVDGRKE
jgi:energy-coupling factor transporter ATP-binding protein EcfA2